MQIDQPCNQRSIRVGLTCDIETDPATGQRRYRCADQYAGAIAAAGAVPMLLAPVVDLCDAYLDLCDGFVLTGGDDPKMEPFGDKTHSRARVNDPQRQAFETTLLMRMPAEKPVLGVCLGMQMMALVAGGRLNQYLPDNWPTHADHTAGTIHQVTGELGEYEVASRHRQAVIEPGRDMDVVARAHDGLIEAIRNPNRLFYLGVQWHPERSGDGPAGWGLFRKLVEAAVQMRAFRQ